MEQAAARVRQRRRLWLYLGNRAPSPAPRALIMLRSTPLTPSTALSPFNDILLGSTPHYLSYYPSLLEFTLHSALVRL